MTFGRKVMLLPALAGLGFALVLGLTHHLGQQSGGLLDTIQAAHVPRVQLALDLEALLSTYQRALQDAVAAEDPEALHEADARRRRFQERLEEGRGLLGAERYSWLSDAFGAYATLAQAACARLIARDDGAHTQLAEMTNRFRAVKVSLEGSTAEARADMASAFVQARALHERSQRTLTVVVLGCLALLGLLSAWVVTQVTRPLQRLNLVAQRIATQGDLTQDIDIHGGDEIGQLADSLRALVERLRKVPLVLADEMVQLESALESLARVSQFQAGFLERQSHSLTQATSSVKAIEATAAQAAGQAEMVQQVVGQAEAAGTVGQEALDASVQSLEGLRAQVENIVRTITELAERNVQVGSIAASVRDLASQSNVLALNATLEAARAGEHGRGFSVVASEIRTLAGESVKSTQRIGHILRDIQSSIRKAVSTTEVSSREMASGINQVLSFGDGLREMTGVLQESGRVAQQIASAVRQQNEGVAQLTEVMVGVVNAVGELQGSTRAAEEEVERVQRILERVKGVVAGFRVAQPGA